MAGGADNERMPLLRDHSKAGPVRLGAVTAAIALLTACTPATDTASTAGPSSPVTTEVAIAGSTTVPEARQL